MYRGECGSSLAIPEGLGGGSSGHKSCSPVDPTVRAGACSVLHVSSRVYFFAKEMQTGPTLDNKFSQKETYSVFFHWHGNFTLKRMCTV